MSGNGLINKINIKTAVIGVIGLGHTGLPLAVAFAEAGFTVAGIDIDKEKIDSLKNKRSYHLDITSERLAKITDSGMFTVRDTLGPDGLDCIVISVPTPLNKTKDPDVSYILEVIEYISGSVRILKNARNT